MTSGGLFASEERERLRTALIARARSDREICAAAHTGSYALGCIDRWSDIDLALSLCSDAALTSVVTRWTEMMYRDHRAVAHQDVYRDSTLFRVFLLVNTLQVDIAFWRPELFGPTGPAFRIAFGSSNSRPAQRAARSPQDLVGMAWLYALHVRSSVNRGRFLEADHMLNGMRDHIGMLITGRLGLRTEHGRGLDDLPSPFQDALRLTRPERLDQLQCRRALQGLVTLLSAEVAAGSGHRRLEICLATIANTTGAEFV